MSVKHIVWCDMNKMARLTQTDNFAIAAQINWHF